MKTSILIAVSFLTIIIYAGINYSDGEIGKTLRDGGEGCSCHGSTPSSSVSVWFEGMDSVFIGDTVQYKLLMTGGPAVDGGFNVASYYGELLPADTLTKVLSGELTHTFPNPFVNDTVYWEFIYIAPDSLVTDTLYSVANSVNGTGNPAGDEWNFSDNFPIHILDNPTNTENEIKSPMEFVLEQNYPNPFNPSTTIKFTISDFQFTSLKVYDVLGNEVATLVSEVKPAGNSEIEFNATGLPSGVYFYQLKNGSYVETKKMILLR